MAGQGRDGNASGEESGTREASIWQGPMTVQTYRSFAMLPYACRQTVKRSLVAPQLVRLSSWTGGGKRRAESKQGFAEKDNGHPGSHVGLHLHEAKRWLVSWKRRQDVVVEPAVMHLDGRAIIYRIGPWA
ncbi:unnamed protein product [Clonostachys rosea]|uniref:Uncharacterized protein n=1 Tax=Bionectria ochroleuca TaxID=29856 RepID=A0ABY6URV5_BIOOC|nr:unnamed protein product [Clonostachys rosea]